ncbi:MAG TPA: hypothetical protein PKA37_13665 [Planctomycetota bacterium]|nr:hypothetical protein [Planctomycetota bacterium]
MMLSMMLRSLQRKSVGRTRMTIMCGIAFVATILLPLSAAAQGGPVVTAPVAKTDAKKHIVVLGASASDGFGLDVRLSDALIARLDAERFTVENRASSYFFIWPEDEGKNQLDAVKKLKPSAVIGVDFLFWFAYGKRKDEDRPALLEKGLKLLESLELPLVLAELPDMSEAIGLMLRKQQVPSKETLAILNARIREWAKDRKHVILVPLGQLLDRMRKGEDLQMEGLPYDAKALPPMLQADKLHPTLDGVFVLAELSLVGLRSLPGILDAAALRSEPTAALQSLKATSSARAKAAAEPAPLGK